MNLMRCFLIIMIGMLGFMGSCVAGDARVYCMPDYPCDGGDGGGGAGGTDDSGNDEVTE